METGDMGFFSALVFGLVFSVGWTPCVGAFLGSALMLASQQGQALTGMLMLLAYSLGLGIPFVISALLIDYLKSAFDWIKRNYRIINAVCGWRFGSKSNKDFLERGISGNSSGSHYRFWFGIRQMPWRIRQRRIYRRQSAV